MSKVLGQPETLAFLWMPWFHCSMGLYIKRNKEDWVKLHLVSKNNWRRHSCPFNLAYLQEAHFPTNFWIGIFCLYWRTWSFFAAPYLYRLVDIMGCINLQSFPFDNLPSLKKLRIVFPRIQSLSLNSHNEIRRECLKLRNIVKVQILSYHVQVTL